MHTFADIIYRLPNTIPLSVNRASKTHYRLHAPDLNRLS